MGRLEAVRDKHLQSIEQEQSGNKHCDESGSVPRDIEAGQMDWEEISVGDAESRNATPRMTPPESVSDFQMEHDAPTRKLDQMHL